MSDDKGRKVTTIPSPHYPALFEGLLDAGCATVLTSEGPVEIDADRFTVYPEVVAFFADGETTGVFERGHSAFQGFINGELDDEDDDEGYLDPDSVSPFGPEDEEDYICDDCRAMEAQNPGSAYEAAVAREYAEQWMPGHLVSYDEPIPFMLNRDMWVDVMPSADWRNPNAYR